MLSTGQMITNGIESLVVDLAIGDHQLLNGVVVVEHLENLVTLVSRPEVVVAQVQDFELGEVLDDLGKD